MDAYSLAVHDSMRSWGLVPHRDVSVFISVLASRAHHRDHIQAVTRDLTRVHALLSWPCFPMMCYTRLTIQVVLGKRNALTPHLTRSAVLMRDPVHVMIEMEDDASDESRVPVNLFMIIGGIKESMNQLPFISTDENAYQLTPRQYRALDHLINSTDLPSVQPLTYPGRPFINAVTATHHPPPW